MTNEIFESIPTWAHWSQVTGIYGLPGSDPAFIEKVKCNMAFEAHPTENIIHDLHSRHWRRINRADRTLKTTKWGRCRIALRRKESNEEERRDEDVLHKIVHAKWAEDDYAKRIQIEEQPKLEAQNMDTVGSEAEEQTTDTTEEFKKAVVDETSKA